MTPATELAAMPKDAHEQALHPSTPEETSPTIAHTGEVTRAAIEFERFNAFYGEFQALHQYLVGRKES